MSTTSQNTPYEWHMTVYHGDTWPKYSFEINDSANAPRDLSSAQILMQVRVSKDDAAVVKAMVKPTHFTVSGTGNNKVTFSTQVDIAPGDYVYDLQITYASGEVKTYFMGSLTVIKDISETPA